MSKINWQNLFIVAALVMAAVALILPQQIAPAAPVVSPQSFQCAPGTMCVQNGGKTVDMLSGAEFDINAGAVFTIAGLKQYAVSYWDMDGVNGAMAAHGLPGAPTYPHCMLYTPIYPVTATVYISAANATSVTLAMVDFAGSPYTGTALAVRCSAVYVP